MKSSKYNPLVGFFVVLVFMLSNLVRADDTNLDATDPYEKIERVTADLLVVIGNHKQGYPQNEVDYFQALNALLHATVDFKRISRSVMGSHFMKATPQQRSLFSEKFRQGLVETYGRGLINYGDEEIFLLDRKPLKEGQRKLTVRQEIRSDSGVFSLQYSMARKKTGEWMVVNIIINGINLGKPFHSQFNKAAQKSAGDLDIVIAEWATEAS